MKYPAFTDDELLLLYKQVGKNVKKYREKNNMSQLELTLAMGLKSVSLISAAELVTKGRHFNIEHIYKISKILNIDMATLIELK